MDPLTIITIIGIVVGIIAGFVQVFEYFQKRREGVKMPKKEPVAPLPAPSSSNDRQIPHNLPPRSEFIGRDKEIERLHEAFRTRYHLVSIEGIGGIGKTSLALELAHEYLKLSKGQGSVNNITAFDGFIWTTAKDRELNLNLLLDAIARTLDYPGITQMLVEEKLAAVQKLLRDRPFLIIVDNLETVTDDHIKDFLLQLPEPSKALITTREQKIRQAWTISLKGLEDQEALNLIRNEGNRLGLVSVVKAEDQVLLQLCKATGGAPLAIKWAVGQIKQPGQSLDKVLASLYEARGSIFDAVFARSWSLLSESARQTLMVTPLFATSASASGIEAASNVHHFALDEALGQLVEMSLVDVTDHLDLTQRRYNIHPLTRSFARVHLIEVQGFELEARLRLATFFIEESKEHKGDWGDISGFPWFDKELPNMIAIFEWAYSAQKWDIVTYTFHHLYYYLGTRGYWQERIQYGQMALSAAKESGDHVAAADCQDAMGWILFRQGKYDEADRILQSSIQFYLDHDYRREASWAMITLAKLNVVRGNLEQARKIINTATRVAPEDYDLAPRLLAILGHIEIHSGNFAQAGDLLHRALEASRRKPSALGSVGSRQIDLGEVALAQNQLDEAASHFQTGLLSSKQVLRQENIAKAELGLAKVNAIRGNNEEAIKLAESSHEQFTRMFMENEANQAGVLLNQLRNKNVGPKGIYSTQIGILAYGSLIDDPSREIEASRTDTISGVETPFRVEFARSSRKRGGAPTLVPVEKEGGKVRATIIVLDDRVSLNQAMDILYRREIDQVGDLQRNYNPETGNNENAVRIGQLRGDQAFGLDVVLYTIIGANIDTLTPEHLAELAIQSALSEAGIAKRDGISYLQNAIQNGIETPLTREYEQAILLKTETSSLEEAWLKVTKN